MAKILQDVYRINNPNNHALPNANPEKWSKKDFKGIKGKIVRVGYLDHDSVWGIVLDISCDPQLCDQYVTFLNLESMEVEDIDSPKQIMEIRNFDWKVLLNI